jgi:septation ring formation regulator EzrA
MTTWGNPDDPVRRWREDADRLEQEHTRLREQERRERERHERAVANAGASEKIAALEQRLATVEQQLEKQFESFNELVRGNGEFSNTVVQALDRLNELVTQLNGKMGGLDKLGTSPEAKRASFQFAREKSGEVVDLSEFLTRRTH